MSPRTGVFDARVDPKTSRRVRTVMRKVPAAVKTVLKEDMVGWGNDWLRIMTKNRFRQPFEGSRATTRLHNRSHRLRNSLNKIVRGNTLESLNLRAFSAGVPYADTQEFGGTIRSNRPGGNLTIPLEPMKTRTGVTRMSARAAIEREGGLTRDGGNAFFYRSDAGNLLLARYKGKRKRVENLFLLVKSVTIPGPRNGRPSRFGFYRTWDSLARVRQKSLRTLPERALKEARGGVA